MPDDTTLPSNGAVTSPPPPANGNVVHMHVEDIDNPALTATTPRERNTLTPLPNGISANNSRPAVIPPINNHV